MAAINSEGMLEGLPNVSADDPSLRIRDLQQQAERAVEAASTIHNPLARLVLKHAIVPIADWRLDRARAQDR